MFIRTVKVNGNKVYTKMYNSKKTFCLKGMNKLRTIHKPEAADIASQIAGAFVCSVE